VSVMSMIVPFVLGFGFAWVAADMLGLADKDARFAFSAFLGIAMSITALPVIAKILLDLNMFRSDMGMLIMSSAMVNDLLGWIGFAIVLAMIIPAEQAILELEFVIPATLVFVAVMLTGGRWLASRAIVWVQAHMSYPGGILAFVLTMALLCGALTEWIGIHAIFGAFLAGVAIGDSRYLRARTRQTIEHFVTNIFAPVFFAGIALRVDFFANFDLFSTLTVLGVAIVGKVIGAYIGSKWAGFSSRESWAVGFGMSARGAMEIILGQIALQYGLIEQELFVAIVIMAIVTSLMAGPLMQRALNLRQKRDLGEVVTERQFFGQLKAATRRDAIAEMSAAAQEHLGDEVGDIDTAVWLREQAMSTGIGNAVAVPHARLTELKKPVIYVGLAPAGIDFDAPDNQLAEIVCLILTPADQQSAQIELLDMVARAFHTDDARRAALAATNFTEFKAALSVTAAENAEH
ncbi:MAG: cation:proton antiporter, partial [Phycisphaeraceae bacterium]